MKFRRFLLTLLLAGMFFQAEGREYFLAPEGHKGAAGTARDPFGSLTEALPALAPGDTLTLRPGVYSGGGVLRQERMKPGSPKIRIRAEIPGTVLIRGDRPAPRFTRVPDKRFVYEGPWRGTLNAVNERDGAVVYRQAGSVDELEFLRGAFYFDAGAGKLYVVTTDGGDPAAHELTVGCSVLPAGIALGFRQDKQFSSGVEISGLNFTGFNSLTAKKSGGIYLNRVSGAVIRNCRFFLNGNGAVIQQGRKCEISSCTAFGNDSCLPLGLEGGNLIIFGPASDSVIRNCTAFNTGKHGIRFYLGPAENCRIENCLTFGNLAGGIWIKPATNRSMTAGCTALDALHSRRGAGDTALSNAYQKYRKPGEGIGERIIRENETTGFAAPGFPDYRRLGGPEVPVRYASPRGDDRNDGTRPEKPWRTLANARPGQTLYLLPGAYREPLILKPDDCEVRPYAVTAPAVLTGGLTVTGARCRIRGLSFTGQTACALRLKAGEAEVSCCSFGGPAPAVSADHPARIVHNAFAPGAEDPLALKRPGSVVHSNIFSSKGAPGGCAFAGFNTYTGPVPAGEPGSRSLKPVFAAPAAGDFSLLNDRAFRGIGFDGLPCGPFRLIRENPPPPPGLELFHVSSGSADLEWWCGALPRSARLEWGPEGGPFRSEKVRQESCYGSFTLTDLRKDTRYTARLTLAPPEKRVMTNRFQKPLQPWRGSISFRTAAAAPARRTFHVSPDGDDRGPGSARRPWKTLNRSLAALRPGDTLMLHAGTWCESAVLRSGGFSGFPIRIRCSPGEKVWWEGKNKTLTQALRLWNKSHVELEGIRFRRFGGFSDGVVRIAGGGHITLSRCLCDGREKGYSPFFVYAAGARNCVLRNCVVIRSAHGVYFGGCPDAEIAHCVFFLNLIDQIYADNRPDAPLKIHHCIFVGPSMMKVRNAQLAVHLPELLTEYANAGFFRLPEPIQFFTGPRTRELTRRDFEKLTGKRSDFRYGPLVMPALPALVTFGTLDAWEKQWREQCRLHEEKEFGRQPDGTYREWDFRDFMPAPRLYCPRGRPIGLDLKEK